MIRIPDYAACVRCNKSFWLDDLNADRICIYCQVKQRRKVVQITAIACDPKTWSEAPIYLALCDDGAMFEGVPRWDAETKKYGAVEWTRLPDIPQEEAK